MCVMSQEQVIQYEQYTSQYLKTRIPENWVNKRRSMQELIMDVNEVSMSV